MDPLHSVFPGKLLNGSETRFSSLELGARHTFVGGFDMRVKGKICFSGTEWWSKWRVLLSLGVNESLLRNTRAASVAGVLHLKKKRRC